MNSIQVTNGASFMSHQQPIPLSPPAAELRDDILHHLRYSLGKTLSQCTNRELCLAVSLAVRNRLLDQMLATESRYQQANAKRLYYLSMEFLMGRSLSNNIANLRLTEACQSVLNT